MFSCYRLHFSVIFPQVRSSLTNRSVAHMVPQALSERLESSIVQAERELESACLASFSDVFLASTSTSRRLQSTSRRSLARPMMSLLRSAPRGGSTGVTEISLLELLLLPSPLQTLDGPFSVVVIGLYYVHTQAVSVDSVKAQKQNKTEKILYVPSLQ